MIRDGLQIVTYVADGIGILIMLAGFVLALWQLVPVLVRRSSEEEIQGIQLVRCRLGSYLVLALEFMIVSDLVHSVLTHELEDLYFLGVLVVLRTMIAFFLNKEIQEIAHGSSHVGS